MKKEGNMIRLCVLFSVVLVLAMQVQAEPAHPRLPGWEIRDGENEDQMLRNLLPADGALVGVVISETAENGEAQLHAILRTQSALEDAGVEAVDILHLHVIAGAPRLVQGFIRRGIRGAYEEDFDRARILMAFTGDNEQWLAETGLEVTEQALWLGVTEEGYIEWSERDSGGDITDRILVHLENDGTGD